MSNLIESNTDFDVKRAIDCAVTFSKATKIGTVFSDVKGNVLHEEGYGSHTCKICSLANLPKNNCTNTHNYGMLESERFGGKYIYFCPMGLNFIVVPIIGSYGSSAKIVLGPFLMVELGDYIECDLKDFKHYDNVIIEDITKELVNIPFVQPNNVSSLATLLFMCVSFVNNSLVTNQLLEAQNNENIQGQISSYIFELKLQSTPPLYPFDIENDLLHSIASKDKMESQRLLNNLLGHILFNTGDNFSVVKARIYELLVLISRSAIDCGADPETSLNLSFNYSLEITKFTNTYELCNWLSLVLGKYIDSVFNFSEIKHSDIIHKALQYIRTNYHKKITLDDIAREIFISPSYFSKIFKLETGESIKSYLNHYRVSKSKELMKNKKLRLTDISLMVGFEDQSYFTKVFKRLEGVSPIKYRENHKK